MTSNHFRWASRVRAAQMFKMPISRTEDHTNNNNIPLDFFGYVPGSQHQESHGESFEDDPVTPAETTNVCNTNGGVEDGRNGETPVPAAHFTNPLEPDSAINFSGSGYLEEATKEEKSTANMPSSSSIFDDRESEENPVHSEKFNVPCLSVGEESDTSSLGEIDKATGLAAESQKNVPRIYENAENDKSVPSANCTVPISSGSEDGTCPGSDELEETTVPAENTPSNTPSSNKIQDKDRITPGHINVILPSDSETGSSRDASDTEHDYTAQEIQANEPQISLKFKSSLLEYLHIMYHMGMWPSHQTMQMWTLSMLQWVCLFVCYDNFKF